jgi:hypothetical protein
LASLNIDIDTTGGAVAAAVTNPAPPGGGGPQAEYYRGTVLFGAVLPLDLYGLPQTADNAWFGQSDNPLLGDPEEGVPLVFSCAGSPVAPIVAPPFTEAVGAGGAGPPFVLAAAGVNFGLLPIQPLLSAHVALDMTTGQVADIVAQTVTTITVADPMPVAAGAPFGVYNVASAFGSNRPFGAKAALCAPGALIPEPGYAVTPLRPGETVFTAMASSNLDLTGSSPLTPATASNYAPLDMRLDESVDADSDGIPDPNDNCTTNANGPLAGVCYSVVGIFGRQTDTDSDGYGQPCDSDSDEDGVVASADSNFFINALTGSQDTHADADCDGVVTGGADATAFVNQFTTGVPGPSGLSCATAVPTIPCLF